MLAAADILALRWEMIMTLWPTKHTFISFSTLSVVVQCQSLNSWKLQVVLASDI